MSKKGLLNEATVRRFMGLAGMEAKIVSNTLKEMYKKRDDEEKMEEAKHDDEEDKKVEEMKYKRDDEEEKKMEEMKYKRDDEEEKMEEMKYKRDDEEKMEEAMYAEEEPGADDEMAGDDMPDMDAGGDAEVELSPEQIRKLKALKDAAMEAAEVVDMLDDAAGEEGPELDGAPDADEPPEEDEEVMEALAGINLELNEDELVQEVAKRVAKRLLRAKRAQTQLDEALGRKRRTK